MNIIGLWLDDKRGLINDTFKKSIESLGHEVTVVDLLYVGAEADLLRAVRKRCDLILHVPFGGHFNFSLLKQISIEKKIPVVMWGADDDWFFDIDKPYSTKNIAKYHDYIVTMFPSVVQKYKEIGCENVILETPGYSKTYYYPKKKKKTSDLYFSGRRTAEREHYIEAVKATGYKFVYHLIDDYTASKPIDEMIGNIRSSKIGLNFTRTVRDGSFNNQIKGRIFEMMGAGTFVLTEHCPEIENYFNVGEHLETFKDKYELSDKIFHYMIYEEEREKIAKQGSIHVKQFSYELKFKRLFDEIKNSCRLV